MSVDGGGNITLEAEPKLYSIREVPEFSKMNQLSKLLIDLREYVLRHDHTGTLGVTEALDSGGLGYLVGVHQLGALRIISDRIGIGKEPDAGIELDVLGDIHASGNITAGGNITLGDADTDNVIFGADIKSHLIPDSNIYNLGSNLKQWNDIHIDGTAYVDAIDLNGTIITATAAELNKIDGYTGSATELNYAKSIYDTGVTAAEIDKLDGFTGAAADLNYAKDLRATGVTTVEFDKLDGLIASTTELNYVNGVTSAIQTQLNGKVSSASPIFTGDVTMPGTGIWNSTGSVGIGTISPGEKLHLEQTGADKPVIRIEHEGTGDAAGQIAWYRDNAWKGIFYLNKADKMILDVAGNVNLCAVNNGKNGMGTDNPDEMLHVKGTSHPAVKIEAATTDHTVSLNLVPNGIGLAYIGYGTAGGNDLQFYSFKTAVGNVIRFTDDGDVGIGTTIPGYKLDVNGDIHCTDLYSGDLHLKNEKGDWIIQEEEDCLIIINNKTGKRFKLLMEEVI